MNLLWFRARQGERPAVFLRSRQGAARRGLTHDLRDLLGDAALYVGGPEHLRNVHREEEPAQKDRLGSGHGEVLNPLAYPYVHREVGGLPGDHDRECSVGREEVAEDSGLRGLDDVAQRCLGRLRLVTFRLQLLLDLLCQLV